MTKTLHPNLLQLKRNAAGLYPTASYSPDVDLRVKATGNTTEGYIAVFGVKDDHNMICVRGCFAKSLRERGPKTQSKNKIAFLGFHNVTDPVGQFVELKEDDYGLYFKAIHNEQVQRQREIGIQINDGTLNQFSFGFLYIWDKMEWDDKQNGALCYELDLREGSVLTINASNEETYAIRSKEEILESILQLGEKAENLFQSFPKEQQLELRQLIAEYKALAGVEPKELSKRSLNANGEPPKNDLVAIGGYKLNPKQFLIS